jgi:hypothetical protein
VSVRLYYYVCDAACGSNSVGAILHMASLSRAFHLRLQRDDRGEGLEEAQPQLAAAARAIPIQPPAAAAPPPPPPRRRARGRPPARRGYLRYIRYAAWMLLVYILLWPGCDAAASPPAMGLKLYPVRLYSLHLPIRIEYSVRSRRGGKFEGRVGSFAVRAHEYSRTVPSTGTFTQYGTYIIMMATCTWALCQVRGRGWSSSFSRSRPLRSQPGTRLGWPGLYLPTAS